MTISREGAAPRRSIRIVYFQPVKFLKPEEMLAQGVDLALDGLGMRARKPLAKDTPVELELFGGRAVFFSSVRWCRPLGSGFRIGVQFREWDAALVAHILETRAAEAAR